MRKLKLGPIIDDRPVKLTVELSAELHRDLVAYAEALSRETGQQVEPTKLVAPMLARFLASDRGFRSARRAAPPMLAPQRQSAPPREGGS
ncbi:DUF2274 domain-containing protein [Falsiroseomonas sp. HC035]|uniref:DUF2274 domain-containing protein n=1 Tax=Falsiroseomonas sp. HC035 TaxID=3390999 RepID=UPI003D310383